MKENYNLGIIGYGGMGKWHHLNMERVPGVKAAAVYDISPAARERAAGHGLTVYDKLEDILADGNVDIIVIATPNEFHCPYAIESFKAGKHVITEKPAALSSDELARMIEASEKYGRVFSVHQNRRWDNDYLMIKKIYDDGTLGEITALQSRVMGSRGIPGDWRAKKESGGGMILDWGVHLIDQALDMIQGKVTDVYARMYHVKHSEVDDGFQLTLTFDSGIYYTIEVSTTAYISLPRWHIAGADGTAFIEGWECSGKIIKLKENADNKDAVPIKAGAGLTKTMAPRSAETTYELPLPEIKVDEWVEYYTNFAACIEGRETLIVTPGQVMRVMKVMEAAFASEKENRCISVDM